MSWILTKKTFPQNGVYAILSNIRLGPVTFRKERQRAFCKVLSTFFLEKGNNKTWLFAQIRIFLQGADTLTYVWSTVTLHTVGEGGKRGKEGSVPSPSGRKIDDFESVSDMRPKAWNDVKSKERTKCNWYSRHVIPPKEMMGTSKDICSKKTTRFGSFCVLLKCLKGARQSTIRHNAYGGKGKRIVT